MRQYQKGTSLGTWDGKGKGHLIRKFTVRFKIVQCFSLKSLAKANLKNFYQANIIFQCTTKLLTLFSKLFRDKFVELQVWNTCSKNLFSFISHFYTFKALDAYASFTIRRENNKITICNMKLLLGPLSDTHLSPRSITWQQ